MNRLMQWVMAAALICSSTVFTSCSNDDNSVDPAKNLSEKIIGKWMQAEINGEPVPTDIKSVYTFVSTTKAFASASKNNFTKSDSRWSVNLEYAVVIDGNNVKLTANPNESVTLTNELAITAINDTELFCNFKHTTLRNGQITGYADDIRRYEKITNDYSEAVLGTWEGHVTNSEGSVYDDGETHRWEYKADGTYVYYEKDGDDWVPYKGNTLNEYFVDGVLLCTRWIDNDVENREWWEIVSIKDGVMKWKGLRQKEDGTTYTATFEMKKVE